MFNLIRRISGSVHPRSDRPWNDDPTSNAPTLRKRRRDSSEHVRDEEEEARKKRAKPVVEEEPREGLQGEILSAAGPSATEPEKETPEVKEVIQGVQEVELEDKPTTAPENIPLPADEPDDLQDPATSPPPSDKGDPVTVEPTSETAEKHEQADVLSSATTVPTPVPETQEKAEKADDVNATNTDDTAKLLVADDSNVAEPRSSKDTEEQKAKSTSPEPETAAKP